MNIMIRMETIIIHIVQMDNMNGHLGHIHIKLVINWYCEDGHKKLPLGRWTLQIVIKQTGKIYLHCKDG